MPRKPNTKAPRALGRAIDNDRRRRAEQLAANSERVRPVGVFENQAARSVLDQSSLDTFLAEADLAQTSFEAVRGVRAPPDEGPRLVSNAAPPCAAPRLDVPIPWRPQWHEGMAAEELSRCEETAFLDWRRGLAKLEECDGLVLTPYERNLDFWRQLWRCVDRSALIVQILDARDPDFYRCRDLERYVRQWPGKAQLILANKSDFLQEELRTRWGKHFKASGMDVVFFSALRELHTQQRLEPEQSEAPHGPLSDNAVDVADCARLVEEFRARLPEGGTVGFVGYPNVGKSSVINALFGAKKVSMSRTPGKTKHLQTLELPELGLTLCDCPGLVFPSAVATRAHLAINGTVPLSELRDALAPVRLIVAKLGVGIVCEQYGLSPAALRDGSARMGAARDEVQGLLAALASTRGHSLRLGVPDTHWAARRVLHDFCTGALLHCEVPADGEQDVVKEAADEGSDFEDLDAFLAGQMGS